MSTAVITIVHGRHDHVRRQLAALERHPAGVDLVVVVAMDDQAVEAIAAAVRLPIRCLAVGAVPLGLPLAYARNVGAAEAMRAGADVLVFLDADCIPDPGLVAAYVEAARSPATSGLLLCGPVAYLPESADPDLPPADLAERFPPHPARPAPLPGQVVTGADHVLFWSLSFAVTSAVWNAIGGFAEQYVGYGGEDTDFAEAARRQGIGLAFVGDARAFHQYHPTADPPLQHLIDIVRNANLYRRRWGSFPMSGWLRRFEQDGRIALAAAGDHYVLTE